MATAYNLGRFIDAQNSDYETALSEIRSGRKRSHWMWYIFPQILGLGSTETSRFYAIKDLEEAQLYLQHPILGKRIVKISEELVELESNDANKIFGSPDDLKLKSSMTLFASVTDTNPVFEAVLEKFFKGVKDQKTLQIIKK
ncbi:MAG: DUF1810 domain-containing protein [Pedobacter sp.]|uniref:DUF1810 domain-containing protein n=1 Tax=Pedobacter sp. TaxID=1411316 RepID=UPI00339A3DAE